MQNTDNIIPEKPGELQAAVSRAWAGGRQAEGQGKIPSFHTNRAPNELCGFFFFPEIILYRV